MISELLFSSISILGTYLLITTSLITKLTVNQLFLKSNLTTTQNLVFVDLTWFNLLLCCSNVEVYSRVCQYIVTALLGSTVLTTTRDATVVNISTRESETLLPVKLLFNTHLWDHCQKV